MKKYLRYANLFVLGTGAVGFLLMCWLFGTGTDERGLYPANHPSWILLSILSAAVVVAIWLLIRKAGSNRSYRMNFPPSIVGALGCTAAGIGLLAGGSSAMGAGNTLGTITGILGIVGAIPMLWAAVCRFKGLRNKLPVHILPCIFFTLQLFMLGQEFGAEPEMYRYLYRFWASVTMVPACYWLWSFDVKMGKRRNCLFWCLVAGYCNLVAAAHAQHWLLHGCMALWMLTALPQLRYLPKQAKTTPAEEIIPAEPEISLPDTPTGAMDSPAEQVQTSAEVPQPTLSPLAVELPDPDAILQKLLQEYDQEEHT